jgi:hypothetical protein
MFFTEQLTFNSASSSLLLGASSDTDAPTNDIKTMAITNRLSFAIMMI